MSTVTKTYYHNIDLDSNQLINAVIENRTSAPSTGVDGQLYYNTTDKKLYVYNSSSTAWVEINSVLSFNQVTTALGFTPENSANKGVANGYASLNSLGQIPASQLPATVNTWGAITGTLSNQTDLISYLSANYQLFDGDLTAIAALNTTGYLRRTGSNTWSLDANSYLTANQTIILSGDISGTGTTAITTSIGANVVTNAMLAQIATGSFLGRITLATGNVERLSGTEATTLLDIYTSSLKGLVPASGGGTSNFLRADGSWAAPLSYIPVPTSRTLTINGITYDLSADRTWTIAAGVSSFNTRTGAITLTSSDVTTALGYTPYSSANPSAYISGITSGMIIAALGYTPQQFITLTTIGSSGASTYNGGSLNIPTYTLAGLGGVPTSRTLTINGTSYDLSSDRSWTIASGNIYTADGTLTSDRVVNGGGFTLTLNPVLIFGEKITGITNKSLTSNFTGSVSTVAAAVTIGNDITHTGATSYSPNIYHSRTFATNTGASGSLALGVSLFNNYLYLRGLTASAPIQSRNYIGQTRDDAADVSTSSQNILEAFGAYQTHWQTAGSTIYTNQMFGFNSQINIRSGTVGTAVAHKSLIDIGRFTSNVTLVSNYYAFLSDATVGASGGPSATITNYYGLFLNTPTIVSPGAITNRWGVYAPDAAMDHYFNGNVLLGTASDTGLYKLDINGNFRTQGTATFSSTVLVTRQTAGDSKIIMNIPSTSYSGIIEFASLGVNSGYLLGTGSTYLEGTFSASEINLIAGIGGLGLRTNDTADIKIYATDPDYRFSTVQLQIFASSGNIHLQNDGDYIDIASARLAINSTTQGFLPPRMTAAEKTAITTPATGLIIYQTDGTEGLYQYKSTGWATMGGDNIYTANGTLAGNRTITNGGFTLAIRTGGVDEFTFTPNNGTNPPTLTVYNSTFGGRLSLGYAYVATGGGALTIGTTGGQNINFLTSGTNRAVLTAGGRLLLGTTTEGTNILNVSGGVNFGIGLNWDNANSRLGIGTSTPLSIVDILTTSGATWLRMSQTTTYYYSFVLDNSTGSLSLISSVPSSNILGFNQSRGGNVQIGITTDEGFKLHVNGTAKVSGQLTTTTADAQFGNIGASTGSFRIDGINGAAYAFSVYSSSTLRFGVTGFGGVTTNNGALDCGTANINSRTASIGGFGGENTTLDLYAQAGVNPATFKISSGTIALKIFSTGNTVLGGGTDNASSILNLNSTTKGFLPPRMTATERSNITTPAVGLLVYQTDGTEGLYQYKATGGWTVVAGSGGGSGTVTTISVVSANGFAGTVATDSTTPAITITTTVTGLLKGNGTAISAAVAGTDYLAASALSGYLTSATAASTYQPLDADLTAIAALAGTSGFLKKTAADTWDLDTNTYYLASNPSGYTNNTGTVTSVTLATGTTGTDVNISGSPITTSGTITLNIPNASETARGLITASGQTIGGNKSFVNTTFVANNTFHAPGSNGSLNNSQYLFSTFTSTTYKNAFNDTWTGTTLSPAASTAFITNVFVATASTAPSSGSVGLVANMLVKGVTITTSTGTVTNAASLVIDGATTGATNNYAVWVTNGAVRMETLNGSGTRMVVADANGVMSTQTIPSSGVSGTGTTGKLAKYTGSGTIGNSIISESGTVATVTGSLNVSGLSYDIGDNSQKMLYTDFQGNINRGFVADQLYGGANISVFTTTANGLGDVYSVVNADISLDVIPLTNAESPYTVIPPAITANFLLYVDFKHQIYSCDTSSGNIVINLWDTASDVAGTSLQNSKRLITIKKKDTSANTVTVNGVNSQTIDGSASIVLRGQSSVTLYVDSDNNWYII